VFPRPSAINSWTRLEVRLRARIADLVYKRSMSMKPERLSGALLGGLVLAGLLVVACNDSLHPPPSEHLHGPCETDADCPAEYPVCGDEKFCGQCESASACAAGESCIEHVCVTMDGGTDPTTTSDAPSAG
jgi:hypothetical protein